MMIERYREGYEHERDCNEKMLAMIESVPTDRRNDSRFSRTVDLAAHLAACRENWLDRMTANGENQVAWWAPNVPLETLRPRFAHIESRWTDYLASLADNDLNRTFDFSGTDGSRYRWSI